jgi:hypothetical protein
MTGPFKPNVLDKEYEKFVESPTRANMPAVEVVLGNVQELADAIASTVGSLATQTISFSIALIQIDTWVTVPVTGLLNIFQVEIFDSTNTFQIFVAYRISNSNNLEINSASAQTYTIRIIGA